MAIREGRWDCPTCGSVGLRGGDKACPNCGNSRPEGIRFYLPEDEGEVAESTKLKQARVGPDWLCEYCGASNAGDSELCKQCAAPRGAARSQKVQTFASGEVPRDGAVRQKSQSQPPPPPPRRRKRAWAFGCLALFLALAALLVWLSTSKKDLTVRVNNVRWERTIDIEKLTPVEEEDWTLPKGAEKLSETKEVHHTNRVVDHYVKRDEKVEEKVQVGTRTYVCGQKDLGNGFFEDIECTEPVYETRTRTETRSVPVYREEPVYRTKYKYRLRKWLPSRTERASGSDLQPRWPQANLMNHEREGKRAETYVVIFGDSSATSYEHSLPEAEWKNYKTGGEYILKLNRMSGKIEQVIPR